MFNSIYLTTHLRALKLLKQTVHQTHFNSTLLQFKRSLNKNFSENFYNNKKANKK